LYLIYVSYALTKPEAYARWLELVCGEQPVLIEAARKALGKRKSMSPIALVMEALASVGLGVHADLKDDDSVGEQALALCNTWQLPEPAIGAIPQQGPARITLILNALQDVDGTQGQRLAVLDDDCGNWSALFYSNDHAPEFATLCEQLGIVRLERGQWQ
jgi:hypothetical protein